MIEVVNEIKYKGLSAGVVVARGVSVEPASLQLKQELATLMEERRREDFPPAPLKNAVRDLLRTGGFKPSGRSKPASEYLAQAVKEERFPFINNLVDINNYISLSSGLPASLLDLASTGERLALRYGAPGEKYIFNETGQEIDLAGLICLCRVDGAASRPVGNPVKDSMEAKLRPATKAVVGVVFAPASVVEEVNLSGVMDLFAAMLASHGHAQKTEKFIV
jgi:DNA/RNA-binding domain of Phe-tRNA-synthetase-like protein